jgi:hypothetical protein
MNAFGHNNFFSGSPRRRRTFSCSPSLKLQTGSLFRVSENQYSPFKKISLYVTILQALEVTKTEIFCYTKGFSTIVQYCNAE